MGGADRAQQHRQRILAQRIAHLIEGKQQIDALAALVTVSASVLASVTGKQELALGALESFTADLRMTLREHFAVEGQLTPVSQVELHNVIVGDIVSLIVKPALAAGGEVSAVLVVLESVIAGVVLAVTRLGGDEVAVDLLLEGVRGRLAELRLSAMPSAGSA